MKLIKLKTDHYVVVDDSDIKEGDWCEDNGTIYNIKDKKHLLIVLNLGSPVKITHSTQPLEFGWGQEGRDIVSKKLYDKVKRLSVSEVKELLGVVDVEKKAEELTSHLTFPEERKEGIIIGYTQALEDNKEKKYTEEDLKRYHNIMCLHGNKKGEKFIQSLQPKIGWDVEFIDGKLTLKNYERK